MVETKRGAGFAAHMAVVFATAVLCLGQLSLAVVAITFCHLTIDAIKTFFFPERLWSYLADQGLHILSILMVSSVMPAAWQAGIWEQTAPVWTLEFAALLAGMIFTIRAGHFALCSYLREFAPQGAVAMTSNGALVGALERAVVFVLVLSGLAALSLAVLALKGGIWWTRGASTAIGRETAFTATLFSFAWAIVTAFGTRALVGML